MAVVFDWSRESKLTKMRTAASKWYNEYGWEREQAVIYVSMPFNNTSENVLIDLRVKFLAIYCELGLGAIQFFKFS